jgi:3-hydroxyisobutyrate dehydrogenase
MTNYCPLPGVGPKSPADNDYQGGFAVALMLKDLKLATQAAQAVDASVPMGNAAEALYQMLASAGEGGRDFSVIIEMLRGK